jgi:predicted  nucleic acid-binding Zn-ribbon protein
MKLRKENATILGTHIASDSQLGYQANHIAVRQLEKAFDALPKQNSININIDIISSRIEYLSAEISNLSKAITRLANSLKTKNSNETKISQLLLLINDYFDSLSTEILCINNIISFKTNNSCTKLMNKCFDEFEKQRQRWNQLCIDYPELKNM